QTNVREEVSVSLVFAKGKLAPKQATTIPRLELCAAVLATQAVERTIKELKSLTIDEVVFYTDSKVILGYIQNESRRFYVYVDNRIQIIRKVSEPSQWRYIETTDNPADLATRCTSANVLIESCWFEGPKFLSDVTATLDNNEKSMLCEDDPEVRPQVAIHITGMPQKIQL
ncbi:tubulin polyglutamylase TTLL1, partial [Paramuricea clavata]